MERCFVSGDELQALWGVEEPRPLRDTCRHLSQALHPKLLQRSRNAETPTEVEKEGSASEDKVRLHMIYTLLGGLYPSIEAFEWGGKNWISVLY